MSGSIGGPVVLWRRLRRLDLTLTLTLALALALTLTLNLTAGMWWELGVGCPEGDGGLRGGVGLGLLVCLEWRRDLLM